ncbi:N-6 DNA methylase [Rhizobium oryziradicis]|nr:N-6 DNA methylase [Rhizobium oryziradicis]
MTETPKPTIDTLAALLGYMEHRAYFRANDRTSDDRHGYLVRQAFDEFGIHSVFCIEDGFKPTRLKPIVYLVQADTEVDLRRIWRKVWSQGSVPFLLAVVDGDVFICPAFGPPPSDISRLSKPLGDSLPAGLGSLRRSGLLSCLTWKEFDLKVGSSIDNILVGSIEALNNRARVEFPHLKEHRDLLNSLIGKFLYTYVLIDRGILDKTWLERKASEINVPVSIVNAMVAPSSLVDCETDWTTAAVMGIFAAVDSEINGSVFLIDKKQQELVPDRLCHMVHRVIRGGDVLNEGTRQLSFLDVSFSALRTETISAIYERFVAVEDKNKRRNDGVYYTPPHLADHVLDRVEAVRPIDENSRVIDAAAGSGIFLVGAYRRLMERHAPAGGWSPIHVTLARKLMTDCIHGREKHPQAANVCRFSLYLTLLDYVGRAPIEVLSATAKELKFLPDLSENIIAIDAFDDTGDRRVFTHVIGNPPWSSTTGQKHRRNKEQLPTAVELSLLQFQNELKEKKLPVAHNRLAEHFVWLAKIRLAAPNAVVGLVLPARSFIGRASTRFARSVASELSLRWVGNLSHLRRKLFQGADAATCVVVAENRVPDRDGKVAVYRPLLPSLPLGKGREIWALVSSDADVEVMRVADFQQGPNGWFRPAVLGRLDRRLNEALTDWSSLTKRTFGDFLERSELEISRGGSRNETGIERAGENIVALSAADVRRVTSDFRGLFAGNVILVPRSMSGATYYSDPVAYPSTYNGIIPSAQQKAFAVDPNAKTFAMEPAVVNSIKAYLDSDILRYFWFLFGPTYLMDNARLERGDLLAFPCPFRDAEDYRFIELGRSADPNDVILTAMEAGSEFRSSFEEFRTFRKKFANGKMPKESLDLFKGGAEKPYLKRLRDELVAALPSRPDLAVSWAAVDEGRADVTVLFDRRFSQQKTTTDLNGKYLSSSVLFLQPDVAQIVVAKPRSRYAWTVEQAVSDAGAILAEIGNV